MRLGLAGIVLLLGGCSAYSEAQLNLVRQAQRGVELAAAHQDEQAALVEELHRLRRARLDEAFDRDVVERAALEAEWVLEHRRGYAAAMEVLWQARQASVDADRVARANLAATDAALDRLDEMLQVQRRLP
jgi:hypothetical protein